MSSVDSGEGSPDFAALFSAQRGKLWGLAYRLTGNAEDADDVVQDAFARLVTSPPDAPNDELGFWLARVATNLGIDALRRRRRRAYVGPWLPSPVDTTEIGPDESQFKESGDPEARYGFGESLTQAFLVALEALGPRQRAALLLRDVLGYSAEETGAVLATSAGNVRALHLRARRALESYDERRCVPSHELRQRHGETLERFLACLADQDANGLEAMLCESVHTVTDAGGHYTALAAPLRGRGRVARFFLAAALQRRSCGPSIEIRRVNGLPGALLTLERPVRRQAPCSLLRLELEGDGRVGLVQVMLAPPKLSRLVGL